MGVHFKAGGGTPFFALPTGELHNQILSLDELWNHRAAEVCDRLLEAPNIETRFLVLERFLQSLIGESPFPQVRLRWRLTLITNYELRIGISWTQIFEILKIQYT
ncbi:hypothetical protein [Chlorogloeopsis sp. ULAP02]|uniref:hypothetical protein n=1 Tax=Chlorogloeopsis sp. ULAP02 TaxID=3107926 RepID=UPI0031358166